MSYKSQLLFHKLDGNSFCFDSRSSFWSLLLWRIELRWMAIYPSHYHTYRLVQKQKATVFTFFTTWQAHKFKVNVRHHHLCRNFHHLWWRQRQRRSNCRKNSRHVVRQLLLGPKVCRIDSGVGFSREMPRLVMAVM